MVILFALVGTVVAVLLTPAVLSLVVRRTAEQPLPAYPQAEYQLIAALRARPSRLVYLHDLKDTDFTNSSAGSIYAALCAAAGLDAAELAGLDDPGRDALAAELDSSLDPDVVAENASALLDATSHEVFASLPAAPSELEDLPGDVPDVLFSSSEADEFVMRAATAVYTAGYERSAMAGAVDIVPADTGSFSSSSPTVQRMPATTSMLRKVSTAILMGVSFLVAFLVSVSYAQSAPQPKMGLFMVFATLTLLVLLASSAVISWVDYNTMFLDMRTWTASTLVVWLLAAVSSWAATGGFWPLVQGLLVAVMVAFVFFAAGLVFRLVRGYSGQGAGDTLIVVSTAGVPVALTGALSAGYYSVMSAMLAAIVAWLVGRVSGRLDKDTPFAFGPYLAAGVPLSFVALWLLG